MSINYYETKVLENSEVTDGIYKLVIEDKNSVKPGQFYMILPKTAVLGRPISVCKTENDTVTFCYAVIGKGTKEFASMKKGDAIKVFGPLGNGFDVDTIVKENKRIAIVGGGIGTAPMIKTAADLKNADSLCYIHSFFGFRDDVYLEEEIKTYSDEYSCTTNTGSHGHKGFVTDLLKPEEFDIVLCCGPEIMMQKVVNMCKESGTKVLISMEKHMACGVGACRVCTCKTKGGNKRTCKDGPVFDGYEVEF